ncbi:MAG: dienelactone hydrolase family protein [Vicinamibacterales bacterium]
MRSYVVAIAFALTASPVFAQTPTPAANPPAEHAMEMLQAPAGGGAQGGTPADARRNPNLPPPGDVQGADKDTWAKAQLSSSPRHAEWVDITASNGGAPIKAFVVYPERKTKAPVVIVIHEIFGLTDWIRGVTDQLAKEGFIAVAPDFLSGMGPNRGGSAELGEQGSTRAIGALKNEDKVRILNDVRDYALKMPAANGKVATIGFCWGGGTSFLYALNQPALNAAVSYYGPMPNDASGYADVHAKAPILGLYGGNDSRVDAGIPLAKTELAKLHVTYDPHVFDGAGHGFLRAQGGNPNATGNAKATRQAWPLTLAWLRKYTK